MAYFKINEPGKPIKYIKHVDGKNRTLEFQEEKNGAFYQDDGFFADSEYDFIMRHFKEKYPELAYMVKETRYSY